jgi:hypothetical protein
MATTTNYGWTTPDDTALVKDGASAIRSLGSSVDTTTKALNPSTTLGDIEYRSSTANTNTRLGIGTTGQILAVSGGVPAWTTAAGGGKVLQVVSTTYTTATTIASQTLTDTGLSLSITPTSATSKILVLITQTGFWQRNSSTQAVGMVIQRAGTIVYDMNDNGYGVAGFANTGSTSIDAIFTMSASYLDAPATTAAITYKTQARVLLTADSGQVVMQRNSKPSTITLLEIGA